VYNIFIADVMSITEVIQRLSKFTFSMFLKQTT